MCGLAGYSGKAKVDAQSMRLLLWDNEIRGRQSTGIYGNKLYKALTPASSFIAKENFNRHLIANEVISHTRMASVGGVTIENTHPFVVTNSKSKKSLVGAHNGTLIPDSFDDIKKKVLDSGMFQEPPKTDSLALYQYLAINDFKLESLNDVYGHIALCFVHDKTLHLYRRESRPLYISCLKNKMYFSSREEGLKKIGIEENLIEELPPFVVYKFKEGVNVDRVDLGKPKINMEEHSRSMYNWKSSCKESIREINEIFPPQHEKKHNAPGSQTEMYKRDTEKTSRNTMGGEFSTIRTSDGFTKTGAFDSFNKPRWMPDHSGQVEMFKGNPTFAVNLDDCNDVSKTMRVQIQGTTPSLGLKPFESRVKIHARVDQSGKLKDLSLTDIDVYSLRGKEKFLVSPDGSKSTKTGRLDDDGKFSLTLGVLCIDEPIHIYIHNNATKNVVYKFDLGKIIKGREYSLDIKIPCFSKKDEDKNLFSTEVNKEKPLFYINEDPVDDCVLDEESEDNLINVARGSEDDDLKDLITEKLTTTEQKQKKMLVANKDSAVIVMAEKIKEAEEIILSLDSMSDYRDMMKTSPTIVIDIVKKAKEYLQEDVNRLEKDKEIIEALQ